MKKIIFLDRDGTINVDYGYVYEIEKFAFEKNVIPALQLLRDNGFEFVITTNQSGIGRGYYTEDDYRKFNEHVVSELKKNGIEILKSYFSPYHPEGVGKYRKTSPCRKPETGMLEQAEYNFRINNSKSWVVGDKWADVKCGKNFGLRSILVLRGKAGADEKHKTEVNFIADDLLEAAKYIINKAIS